MDTTLHPLRLGELLDRCFSCYRDYFWLFVGILAIPMAALAAVGVLYQTVISFETRTPAAGTLHLDRRIVLVALAVYITVAAIIYAVGYAAAQGAATHALSRVYLGQPSSITSAYRDLKGRYLALVWLVICVAMRIIIFFIPFAIGIAIITLGAAALRRGGGAGLVGVGALIVVGGLVLGIYLSLPYLLAIPAFVVENVKPRVAIDRCTVLAQGYRWQLFLISLLMTIITWIVALIITLPFTVIAAMAAAHKTAPHPAAQIVFAGISPLAKALTAPLFIIGYTIAYYDRRVRKEGFDLELLLKRLPPEAESGTPSVS